MTLAHWSRRRQASDGAAEAVRMDLMPLVMGALGQRIDDPAAVRLASAIGRKPFKTATPNQRCDIGDRKRLGIEVVANMILHNRAYWPPRKERRTWITWVT